MSKNISPKKRLLNQDQMEDFSADNANNKKKKVNEDKPEKQSDIKGVSSKTKQTRSQKVDKNSSNRNPDSATSVTSDTVSNAVRTISVTQGPVDTSLTSKVVQDIETILFADLGSCQEVVSVNLSNKNQSIDKLPPISTLFSIADGVNTDSLKDASITPDNKTERTGQISESLDNSIHELNNKNKESELFNFLSLESSYDPFNFRTYQYITDIKAFLKKDEKQVPPHIHQMVYKILGEYFRNPYVFCKYLQMVYFFIYQKIAGCMFSCVESKTTADYNKSVLGFLDNNGVDLQNKVYIAIRFSFPLIPKDKEKNNFNPFDTPAYYMVKQIVNRPNMTTSSDVMRVLQWWFSSKYNFCRFRKVVFDYVTKCAFDAYQEGSNMDTLLHLYHGKFDVTLALKQFMEKYG